jgi:NAD(P)H dehydrogenase (quinone)
MRFLVLHAHPVENSFDSLLHHCVVQSLKRAGQVVDDCDLYAEHFQPVLSAKEWLAYADPSHNAGAVQKDVRRLRECEGIVFVFPTWNFGMPAILKGYLDRVWVPGVAFDIVAGRTVPRLGHIKRFAVVTTFGSPWWLNAFVFGNPCKKIFMRGLRHLVAPAARTLWLPKYGMDGADDAGRKRFLVKVEKRFESL